MLISYSSFPHWRLIYHVLTFIYIQFLFAWIKAAFLFNSILPHMKQRSSFLCCNSSAFYLRNSRVSSLLVRPRRSPCHVSSDRSSAATRHKNRRNGRKETHRSLSPSSGSSTSQHSSLTRRLHCEGERERQRGKKKKLLYHFMHH